jgi:hypothetical protein
MKRFTRVLVVLSLAAVFGCNRMFSLTPSEFMMRVMAAPAVQVSGHRLPPLRGGDQPVLALPDDQRGMHSRHRSRCARPINARADGDNLSLPDAGQCLQLRRSGYPAGVSTRCVPGWVSRRSHGWRHLCLRSMMYFALRRAARKRKSGTFPKRVQLVICAGHSFKARNFGDTVFMYLMYK